MSLIVIAIAVAIIVCIRALISYYFFRRYPGIVKWIGYYVLTLVTGIFIFFPSCIFLGNQVCWDYDVTVYDTRVVLLVASAIILSLCSWVWYKIIKDPRMGTSSGKFVATLITVLAVIVGLIIIILGTSSYWAPLVGH